MPAQGLVIGTFRLKEKNMFTFDYIIDGVQTAKKQAIKTFVNHEVFAKQLNSFVDAETAFAKDAAKATTATATTLTQEITKATRETAEKLAKGETVWQEAFKTYYSTINSKSAQKAE
jgi:hypothetical protein